jgi:hypothetical protein
MKIKLLTTKKLSSINAGADDAYLRRLSPLRATVVTPGRNVAQTPVKMQRRAAAKQKASSGANK